MNTLPQSLASVASPAVALSDLGSFGFSFSDVPDAAHDASVEEAQDAAEEGSASDASLDLDAAL